MRLALAADRVFTARADTAERAVVIVERGRIVDVRPADTHTHGGHHFSGAAVADGEHHRAAGAGTARLADGTPVIALPGATILPGLIDAHTHLSIVPSRGNQIEQMKLPAAEQLPAARANVLTDLLSGVTTMRVMGQERDVDFIVRNEITRGETTGPDLVCAGVQLAKAGGHGHALTAVADENDIQRLVEQNVSKGAGLIKIFTTGGVSSVASSQGECLFSPREIRKAAEAAHHHGLKLASHAHGGIGARLAIENGVDTIEHGALMDDMLIEEAVRRNLAVVGTFSIAEHPAGIEAGDATRPEIVGKLAEVRARVPVTWRRILQSGMRVAVGTDSMHGCLGFDIARLVAFGASPARAIRAATIDAAQVCGLDDRGAIEPGRRADLIAVLGDPLADVRALASPVLVMQAGRIVHRVGV